MEYTYTIPMDNITDAPSTKMVLRSDGAWIPTDFANPDYQRYLNPEAEQSTPIVINEAETI